jgi:probable HAF family extracellular repeat protein
MTDLGALPGGISSGAMGINDSGQVVGSANAPGYAQHAFLYTGGAMTDLGTLGGIHSSAYGINNAGQVVGGAYRADGNSHAFLYTGGAMADLGTLGGSWSVARGINNGGQVVGCAYTAGEVGHAFLYSGGVMTDLGTPSGGESYAYGINNGGQVVGYASGGGAVNSYRLAFLYSGGVMTDLNALISSDSGWTLIEATAINDLGQIVGYGRRQYSPGMYGPDRAVLLTPVPEPTSLALLALGGAALLLCRRGRSGS